MPILIRMVKRLEPLNAASADQLELLDKLAWGLEDAWPKAHWQRIIASRPWHGQVLRIRSAAVGVCVAQLGHTQMGHNVAIIMSLHVHPDWQELGIGKLLLKDLLEKAQSHHAPVCVHVEASHEHLISFYEENGFEQAPYKFPDFYGPERDAFLYVKSPEE